MAANNMHNLTTLIKRLEAATSRLEDIASSTIDEPSNLAVGGASPHKAASTSAAVPTATSGPAPDQPPSATDRLPETIEEFDAFLASSVEKYVKLSNHLGGLLAEQASQVLKGFQAQRKFLLVATQAKKPDDSALSQLLSPINEALIAVQKVKEANRPSPVFTQLSAVAEGIMVLAWVTVENRPFKHVEETLGSAQFFGNRVLKEQRDKDPQQAEWIQAFYQVFRDLADYVKQFYPSGVTWNANGQPATEVARALATSASASSTSTSNSTPPPPPPAAGLPPPPPPPGPPPVLDINEVTPTQNDNKGGLGAVFSELNRGDAVTKGLRKVDRSEMTHKNPSLRTSSTVTDASPRGKSPAPGKKPKPESMRAKKPPKKELDGNKWTIENFENEEMIEIQAEISHSILISRCNKTTIVIKGKANAITVENSNRLSLVVDSLVSTVDAVKSQNFALQVLGVIPTVMMDQIDGAQVYFSKESTSAKIFSSKSSGINLNIISGPDEDYKEVPLPYQICSHYDEQKGDLVNEIVSHAG